MEIIQWNSIKQKPNILPGTVYSEDILLLIDGDVFTGFYSLTFDCHSNWFVFYPRETNEIPVPCVPDGWLPRNVLPLNNQAIQLTFYPGSEK
jgi:hypothetical protein